MLIVNAPKDFEPALRELSDVTLGRDPKTVKRVSFSLAFVTERKEVDAVARAISTKSAGDAVVWFAYPKGTSQKYTCEFNRDTGWAALGKAGFEAVRQVAIDEDWSALRFRRVEFIKSMTRARRRAITKRGKVRASNG